jgi:hypothetical protein
VLASSEDYGTKQAGSPSPGFVVTPIDGNVLVPIMIPQVAPESCVCVFVAVQ